MDVFTFNPTNLDPLTETYDLHFYYSYLARWPHLFNVAEGADGTIDGYCKQTQTKTNSKALTN